MERSICYVVGAMPLSWSLCPHPGAQDFVIAADKGYEALEAYGVPPDLVVGDFDSLGRRPSHPNVIQLPSAKDDTDMVYALREGLDRGFRRFVLLGGVGGRLEHTLANLQALSWLTTQGARGVLAGEGTVATVLRDETMTFPAGLTGFWSAFCLSGTAEGVTLRNLKFELTDHTISADLDQFPLGTKLLIDGIVYTVEDKGSGVAENHLDIYFDTHKEALDYGLQKVEVFEAVEKT